MVNPPSSGRLARLARVTISAILGLSLLGGGLLAPTASALAATPRPLSVAQVSKGLSGEVYGFLPYWEIDAGIDPYLRYDLLTTIALFAVYYEADGTIASGTLLGSGRAALITPIVQHAHAAGVRVELTVRPSPDTATANQAFFANGTAKGNAIANLKALVGQLGLDGVNVDVESLYGADFAAYGAWAGALRTALRQADAAARVTVSTNANVSGSGMARKATDNGVDRVFIMGYAYRSSGSSPVGVISPYDRYTGNSGDLDLLWTLGQYDKLGVPHDRLLLGLPYYGMRWPTVSGALHALRSSGGGGVAFFPESGFPSGIRLQYDAVEQAAWFAVQDPVSKAWTETYFDNGTSLRAKYGLAVARGLAGVGMWALGYDRGVAGYWEAIAATFGVLRLAGSDRYGTAAAVSLNLHQAAVDTAIVTTGETFADALGGSAAAGHLGGPLLLTHRTGLPAATANELTRLTPAHILVLGGTSTVSDAVLAQLRAAVPSATVERVSGVDRFATAAALSAHVYPGGAPVAFLANGLTFPDGLAGGAEAARLGGPVLLTAPGTLSDAAAAELVRLAPSQVYVLGGPASVSDAALAAVAAALPGATVSRLAGSDRYATAVAISGLQAPGVPVVYLATGATFADGLTGGAAAGQLGGPLLLTATGGLPVATASELGRLKPRRVVVLGGTSSVSNAVIKQVRTYLALP
ncbi:MAG: cell wall-binding repeat-containing protein [Candidatus Limnocylindrales bacterium]